MTSATAVSTLLNAHGVWEDNWKVGWFVLERIQKWFRNWRPDGAVDSVYKEQLITPDPPPQSTQPGNDSTPTPIGGLLSGKKRLWSLDTGAQVDTRFYTKKWKFCECLGIEMLFLAPSSAGLLPIPGRRKEDSSLGKPIHLREKAYRSDIWGTLPDNSPTGPPEDQP